MDNSHALEAKEVLAHLGVDPRMGLSDDEVLKRQKQHGKNEIPPPPGASLFALILEQFQDLMVLILLGAAVVSFFLALLEESEDRLTAFVEPAVILIILICNAAVGVIQETNAEKAIEKLKESEAREAQVVRGNGQIYTVPSSELVPGDIVIVDVGDKVPADCRLISLSSATMQVDEAMLTGESEAAVKFTEAVTKPNAVNQDKRNILFSGTLVVRGKGTGVVINTGAHTEIGNIATDLQKEDDEKTPLQKKLDQFSEQLSYVIGTICIVVWLINIGHFTDPDHGSVFKGAIYYFKIAVALAVAAIPEGLPAVVTTCLALGTRRMAQKNAIVRSLPSVETLGCTTVICSDKTGTLTTNMMSVQNVLMAGNVRGGQVTFREFNVAGNSFTPIGHITDSASNQPLANPATQEPGLLALGRIASLCNEATLGYKDGKYIKTGAPTEAALLVMSEKIGVPGSAAPSVDGLERATFTSNFWARQYNKEHILEFDRNRKSMSVVVREHQSGKSSLLVKGAPESVIQRCIKIQGQDGDVVSITPRIREELERHLALYASRGQRVLALAYREDPDPEADFKTLEGFADIESALTFVGLACVLDPPREEVRDSINQCRKAGIRVIVITGDNKITAEAICRNIGVFGADEDVEGKSYTGSQFEAMSLEDKNAAVKRASLFSRVEPKHKLELVTLLKQQGEIVAMTGDGVNDATALRKADIGVAMGSGTGVAKEASEMVLQDDNFATIVMAVEQGRAIYANTKQFIRYLISSNIGEVACIFLTAAIGLPEALIPVQLLWVNLVTDGLPATALGFNPPDADIMQRPPRGKDEAIIDKWLFFRYVVIGLYVGIGTVGGFVWWYMYAASGPHISFEQLRSFHSCFAGSAPELFNGIDCAIFHDPRPSTVSLSILVTIEMFNALNALSENQSLLVVTPFSNIYVILACMLSFGLHLMIVYVPFFSNIFHVSPLNAEEWEWVLYLSLPVIFIDEALKAISRTIDARKFRSRLNAQKKQQ